MLKYAAIPEEFKQVDSSHLKEIGYDPDEKKLYIRFYNDSLYEYSGVPEDVYKSLLRSVQSHGKYFWVFIRDNYPYRRIQ